MMRKLQFRGLGFGLALAVSSLHAGELSRDGKTTLKVRVAPSGNPALEENAKELGGYLKRITGAEFPLSSDAAKGDGVLLALAKDCPGLAEADRAKLASLGPEGYLLAVEGGRVVVAGNSELAVQHGTFDLLHAAGCRWLVPGERWTVVPVLPTLALRDGKRFEEPAFASRRIWYAYGMGGDESKEVLRRDYELWVRANRLGGLAKFHTGHSYPGTVIKHMAEFRQHPEWFAMGKDGQRLPPKEFQSLCYSNPEVAKIFVEDRLAQLAEAKAEDPWAFMVSMDPNDGSDECFCPECAKLGNGSDQAIFLANHVARALRARWPDAKVGMYAYASHRLPPEKVKPEPNLVVEIAMGFNKTQYTLEELVKLWRQHVAAIGIRDYLGVMAWDWGLPGRGKGSSFEYVSKMIPRYKEWGAVSFNAEINANWASFGPATWTATRLLWDARADAEAAYADWFEKAFVKGAAGMRELHALWRKDPRLNQNNLNQWLGKLAEVDAAVANEPEPVRARVEDMKAYLHYVALFRGWEMAEDSRDPEKAYAALGKLLKFSWQIRERPVHHSYALQRRLVNAGAQVLRPLREGWRFNDAKAVWKDPSPLAAADVDRLFREDLAAFPRDTRIAAFDSEAAVYAGAPLAKAHGSATRLIFRGSATCLVAPRRDGAFLYKVDGKDASLFDHATGDLLGQFAWKKPDAAAPAPAAAPGAPPAAEDQDPGAAKAEGAEWKVDLRKGTLYRLAFTPSLGSRNQNPSVEWPEGLPVAWLAGSDTPVWMDGSGPFYVFVPKGTKEIICRGSPRLSLVGPNNKRIDVTAGMYPAGEDAARVPVESGDDGGLWAVVTLSRGAVSFLNIPPQMNSMPEPLILPKGLALPPAK
jgi:hypothetical protein